MRTCLITLLLFVLVGCKSGPPQDPQAIEVRSHTTAPWHVEHLDDWQETITNTIAPEDWNQDGSPHRISHSGNVLTIRTTHENQEVIFEYLVTVMTQ